MKFQRSLLILVLFVFLLPSLWPAQAVPVQAAPDRAAPDQAGDEPPWRAVVRPGSCTAGAFPLPPGFVGSNGTIFFIAQDGYDSGNPHGSEIWRSDGSESGTWQVTNLTADSSFVSIDLKIVYNNHLYFTQSRPDGDWLWMTDGVPAEQGKTGAVKFNNFWPSTNGYTLDAFTILGENLYFVVNGPGPNVMRSELWVTNGTTDGTHLVRAITAPSGVYKMVAFNGALYFYAVSETGVNLWRSDGTTGGTVDFTRFTNGRTAWSGALSALGSQLYFVATVNNQEVLFRTDGTSGNAVEVFQIPDQGNLRNMVAVDGTVYFGLTQEGFGELWRTGGSAATTHRVKRFGSNVSFPSPENLTVVGNTLFFLATETINPHEVWKTDGTEAGTVKVTDFAITNADSAYPTQLTPFGNRLYFYTQRRSLRGNQFWVTDGTQAGTQMLFDSSVQGDIGIDFSDVEISGSHLYLTGTTPCLGAELLAIDTPGGSTRLVKDINKDIVPLIVRRDMVEYKGKTYFIANDYIHGNELWQSDGTPEGTKIFMDIHPTGSAVGMQDENMNLKAAGEFLYFTLSNPGPDERQLWKTDGTTAGTQPVRTDAGPINGTFTHPVVFQKNLFFFLERYSGYELWRTDGTSMGTKLLNTMPAAVNGVEFNRKLYFLFKSPYNPNLELWETNGTEEGTQRTTWINGSFNTSSNISYSLIPFKGKLYFCLPGSGSQWALWYTDGTPLGTKVLAELGYLKDCTVRGGVTNLFILSTVGDNSYQISKLNDAGDGVTVLHEANRLLSESSILVDRLYFRDRVSDSSDESLWTSDGTKDGTLELLSNSGPVRLRWGSKAAGGQYFFTAEEASSGIELWTTDGTQAGTRLAADFWSGTNSSYPSIIGADSRRLWVEAPDGQKTAGDNNLSLFVYDLPWVPVEGPKLIFLPFVSR